MYVLTRAKLSIHLLCTLLKNALQSHYANRLIKAERKYIEEYCWYRRLDLVLAASIVPRLWKNSFMARIYRIDVHGAESLLT